MQGLAPPFNASLFHGEASTLLNGTLVSKLGATRANPFWTPAMRIDDMAGEK